MLTVAEAGSELSKFVNIWVILCCRKKWNILNTRKIFEDVKKLASQTQITTKPAKTEAVGLNCGLLMGQIPGKSWKWLLGTISAVCVVSLHVTGTSSPDIWTRHTTNTSKQNHGPKQNITKEIKPTCLIPSRHSWEHSTQLAQHWSRKTCTSLNDMIHIGRTGWINWRPTYFLVAPCLCAGNQRDSGGGGTGRSHDLCHHSPALDIGSLSCPHVKHLLMKSRVEVTKSSSIE